MGDTATTGKLVRDRIPEIIRASGGTPIVRQLTLEEFEVALRAKLIEEANEAAAANGRQELLEELGDVLEVVSALAASAGVTMADVRDRAARKTADRGAFQHRLWLERVS